VRSRLLSYFRCAYPEEKGARILRAATRIEWDYEPSEFAALLAELRQIKRLRPRFNVQMKRDAHHYSFIKVANPAAPKLLVVRGAGSGDGGVYYGPFHGAQRVGEAVRELSDVLGLRDCAQDVRMHFADQRELFPLAPRRRAASGTRSRSASARAWARPPRTSTARRWALARAVPRRLERPADGGAAREDGGGERGALFERAAVYRDKLAPPRGPPRAVRPLRFAVETLSFVYTVPATTEAGDRAYLIRRGACATSARRPPTRAERRVRRARGRRCSPPAERKHRGVPTHEIDELLLLSSWFPTLPDELARTVQP
jgi:excinuclease ABC subunit C